jgi:hypothetical protein
MIIWAGRLSSYRWRELQLSDLQGRLGRLVACMLSLEQERAPFDLLGPCFLMRSDSFQTCIDQAENFIQIVKQLMTVENQ